MVTCSSRVPFECKSACASLAVRCVYRSVVASWFGSGMASRCDLALRQALSLGLGGQWEKVKTAYAAANRALGDIVKVRHLGHSHPVVESSHHRVRCHHTCHACLSRRCRTHPRVLSSDASAVVRANTHLHEPDQEVPGAGDAVVQGGRRPGTGAATPLLFVWELQGLGNAAWYSDIARLALQRRLSCTNCLSMCNAGHSCRATAMYRCSSAQTQSARPVAHTYGPRTR